MDQSKPPVTVATQTPEARLHFLDYWRVIRIRKAIIITVFLITAIIATAVTFILPESYASTATVIVMSLVLRTGASPMRPLRISSVSVDLSISPLKYFFPQTSFRFIPEITLLNTNCDLISSKVVWMK